MSIDSNGNIDFRLHLWVKTSLRAPTVVCGAQWVYSDSATYSPNTTIGASNYINLFPELKEHGLHLRVIFLLGHKPKESRW